TRSDSAHGVGLLSSTAGLSAPRATFLRFLCSVFEVGREVVSSLWAGRKDTCYLFCGRSFCRSALPPHHRPCHQCCGTSHCKSLCVGESPNPRLFPLGFCCGNTCPNPICAPPPPVCCFR
ncbi:unnamed protein product, partial [Discosporangium mesarthrocarpum]